MEEVDLITLVSYLIQKAKSEVIPIDELRRIGHIIEERHPSIIVDLDKYSIESFRIKSRGGVNIINKKIHIDKTHPMVQRLIKDYQPSERLTCLLNDFGTIFAF